MPRSAEGHKFTVFWYDLSFQAIEFKMLNNIIEAINHLFPILSFV